ncbi:hypothetical protein [Alteromonas lipolytica]|uniref:Uncharacterized protein n=1 Tax=Alteromonas lipolytica TaxID=1856405 RepID=A0A1E8FEG1_9ALTE|nr:hypothetical protein [Alteromonas lipolytica]OFI34146.1 hypothetical protein BFC17_21625 [Alteromonas lipolytica]GGF64999.1 hypothetical protein GCM10011338_16690 [Alteromonas lipolytica]
MNINATLAGQVIAFIALFMVVVGYQLGKRKTQTPSLTAFVGFLTAFVPPLAIIFLAILVLKNDIPQQANE